MSQEEPIEPGSLWANVVGGSPDEEHARPNMGEFQQIGRFESWHLRLRVLPERVDWFLSVAPQQPSEDVPDAFLSADLDDGLESLSKLVGGWLDLCSGAHRLALGGVLLQPVQDRQSGYERLSKYLHSVKIDPENTSDFLYQINRSRDSATIPTVKLNRLTKWSVAVQFVGSINVGRGGAIGGVSTRDVSAACRLELDINTAPTDQDQLPKTELIQIFQELITLSKEIAVDGDVP